MRRPAAILLALPPLIYSGAAFLWGYVDVVMQCDEICDDASTDWRFTHGAWQWRVLGGLGVLAFAAGVGFFTCIMKRRPWSALGCLLLGSAAVVAALWGFPVNPGSDQDLDLGAAFIISSAAVLVSGVLAVIATAAGPERLARRSRRRSSPSH